MPDNNLPIRNATTLLQPVRPGERIVALDVLRGFALFGVLLAFALWNQGSPPSETYSRVDYILDRVLAALVDTKAYTLFAALFGLGFSIQFMRARERGISIVPVYCRRLLALLLIGLVHALFLRNGDILVPYAVTGFLLLPFRNASNKALAAGAIAGLLYPYLAQSAWKLTGLPFPQRPETEGASYFASNFAWVRYWYSTSIASWPASLPMFLFGLYMGRLRFFENIAARRRSLRLALISGLSLGVLAYAGRELLLIKWADSALSFGQRLSLGLLWSVHAWGLACFYASSLLLLWQRHSWQQLLAPLAAVGRMALTNYLLQAVFIIPVCIVFNLFDKVTPSLGLLLALPVWLIQLPASVWWLKRFRFGPAEWVWRSLTYGRPQPMRVSLERRSQSAHGFDKASV
ncbi:MAG: DUF418 domain-containing protein [Pyrinomonadaceae bacterium]|nr:DUF418 domain-containing protein [Pyrinomonadaceae bacterium]